MSDEKCKTCGCTPVEGCGGKGFIRTGENHCKACPHLYVKRLRTHLGPLLTKVEHVKGSPLLTPPDLDRTGDNLLIQIKSWEGLLPHLKWALACKGVGFSFRIITDQDIRDVFVGSRKYKSLPENVREKATTYNSIVDLVEGPDLLIIQLGILRYKNRAASSVFYESLRIREREYKPTWIIECDGTELATSKVYDPTVGEHVEEVYEALEIETDVESDDGDISFEDDEDILDPATPASDHDDPDPDHEGDGGDDDDDGGMDDYLQESPQKWRGRR